MKFSDDRGSALVEFVGFGVIVQLALLIWVIQLSEVTGDKLIAESIARHSLRSMLASGVSPQFTAFEITRIFAISTVPRVLVACNPDCNSIGSRIEINVQLGAAQSRAVGVK